MTVLEMVRVKNLGSLYVSLALSILSFTGSSYFLWCSFSLKRCFSIWELMIFYSPSERPRLNI
ncbi:hypothetical protein NMG60_11034287 [Bertholletia excelsa]